MMAHYIDADRLRAEIEKRKKTEGWCPVWKDAADVYYARGFRFACDFALSIIDSLQQEQPEGLHFTPLNRLIQKIPSGNWNDTVNNYAKKLRDCLIKEGYRKDAEVLQGYISYMNGNNVPMATMDGQEQPQVADASKMEQQDVDLNAEINKLYDGEYHDTEDVARHFYELGASVMRKRITNPEFNQKVIGKMKYECPVDEFNARKEEEYGN